jgi:hypothetical protein
MFAVYASHADNDDPLSALCVGEQPEPDVQEGWVRVKLSHASLNRHDLFTLRGITSHREGISFPIIMGNDGAGHGTSNRDLRWQSLACGARVADHCGDLQAFRQQPAHDCAADISGGAGDKDQSGPPFLPLDSYI